MLTLRKSNARGRADFGWLKARHSFSFGHYYDPDHMGFRALRVINEDRIAAGGGFPAHGHRDMEIITYVLDGALAHRDSMGNGAVIRPGEVQVMSAGKGVTHSEFNHASDETHLLQIWIETDREGHQPRYDQKPFPGTDKLNQLRLVVSPDGRGGSLIIHQDALIYAADLVPGAELTHVLAPGRHAWVQVTRGAVSVNGTAMEAGDGAAISDLAELKISGTGEEPAEILLFDLA
jgi:quercetin 2,3-dioxygenase